MALTVLGGYNDVIRVGGLITESNHAIKQVNHLVCLRNYLNRIAKLSLDGYYFHEHKCKVHTDNCCLDSVLYIMCLREKFTSLITVQRLYNIVKEYIYL